MSRRAVRPLNTIAVTAADQMLYERHKTDQAPNALFDEYGHRKPLSAMDPKQSKLRSEWMQLYRDKGGLVEDKPKITNPPAKSCLNCPPEPPKLPPKETGYLIVWVTDDAGNPVEGAAVDVAGVGYQTTDSNGYADFGEVGATFYAITARKDHHSPARGEAHGPSQGNENVPVSGTAVARLQLVPTCKSIYLKKPFLVAQATNPGLTALGSMSEGINDDIFNGKSMTFGQDITHGSGRAAPNGESVGTTAAELESKMGVLPSYFARNDSSGMALRLINGFLTKNSSVLVFTDAALDAAIQVHSFPTS